MNELMQKALPNPEGHGLVSITKYFNDKVCSVFQYFYKQITDIFVMKAKGHHFVYDEVYFSYYMKVYYKYFNLHYPSSSNN
jgi:hypothetical protein